MKRTKFSKPKQKVKITNCHRNLPELQNILPGSIHEVIDPPFYAISKKTWVMGVKHPVRLLKGEYEFIN